MHLCVKAQKLYNEYRARKYNDTVSDISHKHSDYTAMARKLESHMRACRLCSK